MTKNQRDKWIYDFLNKAFKKTKNKIVTKNLHSANGELIIPKVEPVARKPGLRKRIKGPSTVTIKYKTNERS